MKKQKYTPGAIVEVPLDEHYHTYGRLLIKPYIAFYDFKSDVDHHNLKEIISKPILFVVGVYDYAVAKGRWEVVGTVPLELDNVTVPLQFKQDAFPPYKCYLVDAFGNTTPATVDECRGLERLAIWEPEHVEERLRDFYAGRANRWSDSLKPIEQ